MAYIIYPECSNDDIRIQEVDLRSPFSERNILPQKGNKVCMICALGKRVIAKGNSFDHIGTVEYNKEDPKNAN